MPHSSGGGSHGGGSHRGSHHRSSSSRSGGSSSAPRRHASSTAFEGATRYMYYRHKRPVFVYADYDIRKSSKNALVTRILILIFFIIPSLAATIGMLFMFGHFPKRLKMDYDAKVYVDDRVGVLRNPNHLMASLDTFQKKTGITPVVCIYPNDVWKDNYASLEDYAYEDYLNRFDDEKHWLIVYTTGVTEDGFEDWYWEGMQGNDTDPILGSKETSRFTENLHKNLLDKNNSVDEAIALAFDDLSKHAMDKYFVMPASAIALGIEAFFVGLLVLCMDIHPIRERNYARAEICDPKFVDQEPCEYCGGIYVVGMHLNCPHCGAPVKPHDFYIDENGNITNVMN